jgi:hypothetical protein
VSEVIFDNSEQESKDKVFDDSESSGRDMNEASLQAFEQKIADGSIETDKARVYKLIRDLGPIRSKELLKFMDKTHTSEFSGRITELKNKGLVESAGMENGENLWKVVEQ